VRRSGAVARVAVGLALALGGPFLAGCGGQADAAEPEVPVAQAGGLSDVACAVCVFGQTDQTGCPLAIRIGERIYPVEGATVAEHSICVAVQRARVEGELEGDVFVATSVTLVP
jgi:hypothetical protein